MKILVTGGAGKLGRWVVRELIDTSGGRPAHEVTVFDQVTWTAPDGVRMLLGDIEDLGQVMEVMQGQQAVIHLAAVRRYGIRTNAVTFRTNVMGSFNVHEAAWRLGVRRVVSTSSESVLGWDYRDQEFDPLYLPIDESHPVLPQDCYGLSKEVGEAIARSYTRKCNLETVVLRPPWILEPDEMEQLREQGGRKPTRFIACGYVDVRDLSAAFRLAVEQQLRGHHVFYIVADDSSTTEPLNVLLPRLLPSIGDMASDLTEDRPAISNELAKEMLGWRPLRSWRRPDSDLS
jgi:nucleoside-diphosphate-sugar epimerase